VLQCDFVPSRHAVVAAQNIEEDLHLILGL